LAFEAPRDRGTGKEVLGGGRREPDAQTSHDRLTLEQQGVRVARPIPIEPEPLRYTNHWPDSTRGRQAARQRSSRSRWVGPLLDDKAGSRNI
jgi:hypothetical protein